jgi:hypothetical protein
MNTPAIDVAALPRQTAFKFATVILVIVNCAAILVALFAPQTPQDMMVPWLKPFNMLVSALTAAGLVMVWFRKSFGLYLTASVTILSLIVGLMTGVHLIILLVSLGVFALYIFTLHSGGPYSMWRQMFGGVGQMRRGMPYGMPGAPPPPPPNVVTRAPAPPPPPVATARTAASPAANKDPFETLKQLASLRDAGVLSAAEFDAKKAELLKQI